MKKLDYHAKLTIYGLPTMEAKTKKQLIRWLQNITKELQREKDWKIYAKRFSARLMKLLTL